MSDYLCSRKCCIVFSKSELKLVVIAWIRNKGREVLLNERQVEPNIVMPFRGKNKRKRTDPVGSIHLTHLHNNNNFLVPDALFH